MNVLKYRRSVHLLVRQHELTENWLGATHTDYMEEKPSIRALFPFWTTLMVVRGEH